MSTRLGSSEYPDTYVFNSCAGVLYTIMLGLTFAECMLYNCCDILSIAPSRIGNRLDIDALFSSTRKCQSDDFVNSSNAT